MTPEQQLAAILVVWLERVCALRAEVGIDTPRANLTPYQRLPELFASLDHAMGSKCATPEESLEALRAWLRPPDPP